MSAWANEPVMSTRQVLATVLEPVLLAWVLWFWVRAVFGSSQPFEREAWRFGLAASIVCLVRPGAVRHFPLAMVVLPVFAACAAAYHQWASVAATAPDSRSWLALFAPASHLLAMLVFVFGTAHVLRLPQALGLFAVTVVTSVAVLAAQTVYDRTTTNFVFTEAGSTSLPSVAQWGGLHQVGMVFVLAAPLAGAHLIYGRSWLGRCAGGVLSAAFLVAALTNDSTGGLVALAAAFVVMAVVAALARFRWRLRQPVVVGALVAVLGVTVALTMVPFNVLDNIHGRVPIWRAALAMVGDYAAFGVGPERYWTMMQTRGYAATYLPPGSSGAENAHNLFLHAAAELGVVGLACWVAIWAGMIHAAWRAYEARIVPVVALGVVGALSGLALRSMSDNFLDVLIATDRSRIVVWSCFAAATALGRLVRRPETAGS